jgi:hypothetical protein
MRGILLFCIGRFFYIAEFTKKVIKINERSFFVNNLLLPLINHINLHSLFDSDLTTTQLCQLDKINSIGTRFSAFGNSPFLGISNILVFFSCNRTSVLLIKKIRMHLNYLPSLVNNSHLLLFLISCSFVEIDV